MQLSEAGKGRVKGYIFVLGRSLRSFLPESVARDALTEIEGHISERVAEAEPEPDESSALEAILDHLGTPLKVAQAYAGELTIEEAVTTGRPGATLRALWHLATTTVGGFFGALGLFIGYVTGLAFLVIAVMKPIIPDRVGIVAVNGVPQSLSIVDTLPPGGELWGGYWVIPFAAIIGLAVLAFTQRGTMRYLGWWRSRLAERRRRL